jgi:hypothetical protein
MITKFQLGDFVWVRRDAARFHDYLGCRGEVVRVARSSVTVRFLELPRSEDSAIRYVWLTLKPSELVKEDQR